MSASIDAYRSINLNTARPRTVLVKAYGAAIRYVAEAEEALSQGRPFQEPLGHARTIVSGLMSSLNFDAGEISQRLLQLYLFALDRFQTTSATERDAGLADVRRVLETVKRGWEQVPADEARMAPPPARGPGLDLRG